MFAESGGQVRSVGGGGGGWGGVWAASVAESEENASAALSYLPLVSYRAAGSPSCPSPHGVSQVSPLKAPGQEAGLLGAWAASSAAAQEQSGLRKASETRVLSAGPRLARLALLARDPQAQPGPQLRWGVYAGQGASWPGLQCQDSPTLFLSLCLSGPGPHSPNVSEIGVSGGENFWTPPPRVLPAPATPVFLRVVFPT